MSLERVTEPDDERRCQGAAKYGQCTNVSVPGFDYCPVHGGRREVAKADDRRKYLIQNAEYRQRIEELSEGDEVKSLRQEVAMLRLMLEKRFNAIGTDENMMIAACAPITQMMLVLERLIKSTHDMEKQLGMLLSRDAIVQLARFIAMILSDELAFLGDDRAAVVDCIMPRIGDAVARVSRGEVPDMIPALPAPQ